MTKVNSPRCRVFNANGFTLIEVMAALIIVSLGMMAVIQAVSQTASNSAYLREKTLAHWVAMNRVTEMRLLPQPPPTGESAGEVEMAGERWRWSAKVGQTALPTMRRIDVSVAQLVAGSTTLEKDTQLAVITGFYGEKIAQPGVVLAQFDAAAAVAPGGQPATPVTPVTPVTPPNVVPPSGQ